MKYITLFTVIFIFFCTSIFAQQDKQWYINDGYGWNGPQDKWDVPINNDYIISRIQHPDTMLDPKARDDIFVIYDDYNYYSSRYTNRKWDYANPSSNTYAISLISERPAKYLYFTNLYDSDDPPAKVVVEEGIISDLRNELPWAQNDPSQLILANHDVVSGKDITLILNNLGIDQVKIIVRYNKLISADYISAGEVVDWSKSFSIDGIFQESPVFEQDWVHPKEFKFSSTDSSTLLIKSDEAPFTYINLRATEKLDNFIAPDGEPSIYYAIFEVLQEDTEERIAYRVERTGPTNDPNELVAVDVCLDCRTAYYQGSFYNDQEASASGLAMSFLFPKHIDASAITFTYLAVAGKRTIPDSLIFDRNKVTAILEKTLGSRLIVNQSKIDTAKVEFGFCMKIRQGVPDSTIANNSPAPIGAHSYFNYGTQYSKTYELKIRDLTKADNNDNSFNRIGPNNCTKCKSLCPKKPEIPCWLLIFLGLGLLSYFIFRRMKIRKSKKGQY